MIPCSLSPFLYLVASIPQNSVFSLLSLTFFILPVGVLGFPKALLSALFPVYSPLVVFSHHLMALNTAQTGFMQQVSQDAGKQTAGNRAELTMCFPPTSLSHGITKGESSRGSPLVLTGGGDKELLSVSTGLSSLSPLSLFSEVPVPGQPHGSSGRNCLRSMHETEL